MLNFSYFSDKKSDKGGILIALSLFTIFMVGKAIVESGHLLLYIISFVIGILIYFSYSFIQKKNLKKPATLGKTYMKKYPVIIQYAPPKGINPAEAGLLYNCSVEPTDLTSLIYQWKFEKLIDIKIFRGKSSDREYIKLIKLDEMPLSRPLFESEIFDSIFRMGNTKIIDGPYQLRYALLLEDLEYHGIKKGWLKYKKFNFNNSDRIDSTKNKFCLYLIIVVIYIVFSVFSIFLEDLGLSIDISKYVSFSFSEFIWSLVIIFGFVLGLVFVYGIKDGRGKLEFTDKGAELASQIIGYSQFIKSCDENMIKFLLKSDPLFIDRTLPYATAFGMETEFLNKISPLKKDWNAKYIGGHKVTVGMRILDFFLRIKDTHDKFTYGW